MDNAYDYIQDAYSFADRVKRASTRFDTVIQVDEEFDETMVWIILDGEGQPISFRFARRATRAAGTVSIDSDTRMTWEDAWTAFQAAFMGGPPFVATTAHDVFGHIRIDQYRIPSYRVVHPDVPEWEQMALI